MKTVLIVDDDPDLQQTLVRILEHEGYLTITTGNGNIALKKIQANMADVVILDFKLPGLDGISILENLKQYNPEIMTPVIMLTAFGDIKNAIKAMKLGAYDYITKPFDNDELILTIKKALRIRYLEKEVITLRNKLNEHKVEEKEIGSSPAIRKILKQVELIAPTNMNVIIQGKSGTGKEVFAHLIYRKSLRVKKSFIAIDCGAIPDNLVESELFGYEKGAFTGANQQKKGKFEIADQGTLLLDEITNLSTGAQAKLLRAIEESEITPLGGKNPIPFDVRIISTANIDILEAVEQGEFREDLYQRLNEFTIKLPLLKDRREDIPTLAQNFLEKSNINLHKNISGFSPQAMKLLLAYEWYGNIREMKHAIKRAVLLEQSDSITAEVLDFLEIRTDPNKDTLPLQNIISDIIVDGSTLKDIENDIISNTEKTVISEILRETGNNKSKAAKLLGIDRNTLYNKIKNLNIRLNSADE
ncbi:MAG: sigma-54 dependent transcriptional regulator [Candidatus Cloacimonetes bacterium]|nr:sigma-54 dependent transcriptional regulator [Candidatus Cloacimonadota bacterium]